METKLFRKYYDIVSQNLDSLYNFKIVLKENSLIVMVTHYSLKNNFLEVIYHLNNMVLEKDHYS